MPAAGERVGAEMVRDAGSGSASRTSPRASRGQAPQADFADEPDALEEPDPEDPEPEDAAVEPESLFAPDSLVVPGSVFAPPSDEPFASPDELDASGDEPAPARASLR